MGGKSHYMESIRLPTKFEITPGEKPHEGILVLEPCYYGYGTTIGNALRRVLLSSLSGAAVTAVKIKGAQHEFSTLPNVKEDVLEIILNLKLLRLRLFSDTPTRISLKVRGERDVLAADFEKNADVEVINSDLKIATLTDKKAEFELEAIVERGRGYSSTESRPRIEQELGMIMVDALFSPVRNVGYRVENARVGEITNYDRLIMTIETDGTVTPEDAVQQSAQILQDYLGLLLGTKEGAEIVDDVGVGVAPVALETDGMMLTDIPEEGTSEEVPTILGDEIAAESDEEKPKKKRTKKTVKKEE